MYESAARRDGTSNWVRGACCGDPRDYHDANGRLGDPRLATGLGLGATVSTNSGRSIEIRELPWLRARELWMHAIDLDLGPGFADLPDATCTALVGFVTENLTAQPACPSSGRARRWRPGHRPGSANGRGSGEDGPGVRGRAARWASGRSDGAALTVLPEGPLPELPTWL